MCEGGAHGGGRGTAVGLSSAGRRGLGALGLEREITVAVAGGWPAVQHSTGHTRLCTPGHQTDARTTSLVYSHLLASVNLSSIMAQLSVQSHANLSFRAGNSR